MKLKFMTVEEFRVVMERNWTPVQFVGDALPSWMQNIPESIMAGVLLSGTGPVSSQSYSSKQIPSGELIGGIDVYRHSPDDPVPFNKDWYAVVKHPGDPTMLIVDGPQKDAEHWLESISERCRELEVFGVPKKNPGASDESNV
ncbi:MAG: hypothetical protein EPO07_16415 [Verrucomicrobia bacterium]|nr:MAG: hypothetical protein EPO07_16415 [Verrucomicrobiota bacterium]